VSVTERMMANGQWDLTLNANTPLSIRSLIDYFGHIYVFDTPQRAGQSDATMLATSRWGGVVRRKDTPWHIAGTNMIFWLGDEDGKGPIYEAAVTGTGATFAAFVALLLPAAVTTGTLGTVGGLKTLTYAIGMTPREAFDHLCALYNVEYRVNKDATFDAGTTGSGFPYKVVPTAVAMKRSSGRDISITGIPVTQLDVETDAEEYFSRVMVQDALLGWTGADASTVIYRGVGTDSDGTLNDWTVDAGAPTIGSNLISLPTGAGLHVKTIQVATLTDYLVTCRFGWSTNSQVTLQAHFQDNSNYIFADLSATTFRIAKRIAGTPSTVTSTAFSPVSGTVYWMDIACVGTTYSAHLYAEAAAAGTQGTLQKTVSGTISDAGVQSGPPGLVNSGATTQSVGGAYPNVFVVSKSAPTVYKDLHGNLVQITKTFTSSSTTAAERPPYARTLALGGGVLRNQVTLGSDEFDIDRDIYAGDWIWVYDIDGGLFDTNNQVRYRGSIIFPTKLRVYSITWPIERGMSVWYRDKVGVWTDLTNYVEFEPPGVTLEVGASVRPLTTS
jgi:hypothetical protein